MKLRVTVEGETEVKHWKDEELRAGMWQVDGYELPESEWTAVVRRSATGDNEKASGNAWK